MRLTPNFHFQGNCMAAIGLYKEAFDATVLSLLTNAEADPEDYTTEVKYSGLVYHAELLLGGSRVFMSDITGDDTHTPGNSVSIVITYDTAEEVRKAYDLMKTDAVILSPMHSTTYSSRFVSLIDRFGMRWELMTEQTVK